MVQFFTAIGQLESEHGRAGRQIAGHPTFAANASKLWGIRNGIDAEIWDPEDDPVLPQPYGPDTVVEGKHAARKALRARLCLTDWGDKPIVGMVTRLTAQKGAGLPLEAGVDRCAFKEPVFC